MNIQLRDVDASNWIDCINLTTNGDGSHTIYEEFLASNAFSLAQAGIEDGWVSKGIYADDKLVGFVIFGYCSKENFHEILRIMIDYKFQNRGYGKAALEKVIERMQWDYDLKKIHIRFDPENRGARRLYERFGFKDTKRLIDGESVYCLEM